MDILDKFAVYADWISANVGADNGYGKCREIAEKMCRTFPGLEIRKGFYDSGSWGRRQHWWCRRVVDREIVDPTALQHPDAITHFPGRDSVSYDDLTDCTEEELQAQVPYAKCINCGDGIYKGAKSTHFCSTDCHDAFLDSLG